MMVVGALEVIASVMLFTNAFRRLVGVGILAMSFAGVALALALPHGRVCGCAGPLILSNAEHLALSSVVGLLATYQLSPRRTMSDK
jgi:hypothetical protein